MYSIVWKMEVQGGWRVGGCMVYSTDTISRGLFFSKNDIGSNGAKSKALGGKKQKKKNLHNRKRAADSYFCDQLTRTVFTR